MLVLQRKRRNQPEGQGGSGLGNNVRFAVAERGPASHGLRYDHRIGGKDTGVVANNPSSVNVPLVFRSPSPCSWHHSFVLQVAS